MYIVSSSIKHTIQTYPGKSVSLYLAVVDALSCIDYKENYDIYLILTYSFANSLQQQQHSSGFSNKMIISLMKHGDIEIRQIIIAINSSL